jgi:hypothetical protein
MPAHNDNRRGELYALLGDLPQRDLAISAETLSSTVEDGYVLERLVLHLNGLEDVPAYFVKPAECRARVPCVLYNHAHGGNYTLGKDELLKNNGYLQDPSYARALTSNGYAGLCIDAWCFGERRGRSESEVFKEMLWNGRVLWGMMVYDSLRALDYLVSRPDVDATRLATLGISMGSTMAWWLAALDGRIKVCIDLCCMTDFHTLIETRGLDGHGIYYYVPSLLRSFTTSQINALAAPRAHLSCAGVFDALTPPAGLDRVDADMKRVYAEAGAPEAWKLVRYQTGHFESAAMRSEVIAFLERCL